MRNKDSIREAQRVLLREKLVQESRETINQGEGLEDIVLMLHDKGLSIPESVWVLQKVLNRPIAELKDLVTMHPVWETVVRNNEPLHDALENALSKPLNARKNRAKARR